MSHTDKVDTKNGSLKKDNIKREKERGIEWLMVTRYSFSDYQNSAEWLYFKEQWYDPASVIHSNSCSLQHRNSPAWDGVVLNHTAYVVFNFKIQLNRCSNIIFYLRTFHDKIKEWACNLFVSFTVQWITFLCYSHEFSFPKAICIHYDSKNEELLKRYMHFYYCLKK